MIDNCLYSIHNKLYSFYRTNKIFFKFNLDKAIIIKKVFTGLQTVPVQYNPV
jgi:hypothetical protein